MNMDMDIILIILTILIVHTIMGMIGDIIIIGIPIGMDIHIRIIHHIITDGITTHGIIRIIHAITITITITIIVIIIIIVLLIGIATMIVKIIEGEYIRERIMLIM